MDLDLEQMFDVFEEAEAAADGKTVDKSSVPVGSKDYYKVRRLEALSDCSTAPPTAPPPVVLPTATAPSYTASTNAIVPHCSAPPALPTLPALPMLPPRASSRATLAQALMRIRAPTAWNRRSSWVGRPRSCWGCSLRSSSQRNLHRLLHTFDATTTLHSAAERGRAKAEAQVVMAVELEAPRVSAMCTW